MTNTENTTQAEDAETPVADERAPQTTEPAEPAEATTDADATHDEPAEGADEDEVEDNGNKEAAKYRRKLREAEAERDTLAETVAALQRQQIEDMAAHALEKPGALWSIGTKVDDLLAEDGTVDTEKVLAAVKVATDEVGLAPKRHIGFHMDQTGRNTDGRTITAQELFTNAFGPARI